MSQTIFEAPAHRAVMTYNLKNGWNFIQWEQRRDRLAEVIHAERPLLLGTQEGFSFQLRDLRDRLPGYDFVGDGRFSDLTDEHVAIFYDTGRVTIVDSGTFWLAATHDLPGSKVEGEDLPRIATWVRCRIEGHDRELVMVNTHLTYQDIGLVVQTASLVEGIDRIAGRETDVILTGDFNQPRFTPTWQTVTAAGFVDAVDVAATVEGPRFTFPDWRTWSDEEIAAVTADRRIDWIMYRPADGQPVPTGTHLRVVNTHTEPDPPSDHFPVVLSNQNAPGTR
jgi:endonuclease/exonuclease/phosphatase family metal-dependent hydrolase